MRRVLACVAALSLSLGSPVLRAEALYPTVQDEKPRWGLGLGVLSEDEGYRGIGRETEAIPVFYVDYGRFRLFGPQADFRLLGDRQTNLRLRADFRFDGFEAQDGAVFEGMRERKGSASVGLAGQTALPFGQLSFDLVRAVNHSKGIRGGVTYAYPLKRGALTLMPKIGLEYFDKRHVDYYYGVRADEATAARPQYIGRGSVNVDAGVDFQYDLAQNHTLLWTVKYRRFGSAIKDSPLIAKSGSPRMTLGYLYRF
jgi:outer membrane protein